MSPFPGSRAIVKEAFENQGCRPGRQGTVFVMEKRETGYDSEDNDWHWARYTREEPGPR